MKYKSNPNIASELSARLPVPRSKSNKTIKQAMKNTFFTFVLFISGIILSDLISDNRINIADSKK